jgi:hypothetical protein
MMMDALKRLFGFEESQSVPARTRQRPRELSPDEQAIERYRYLLRTAPPETIEEAHREAFAKLTPEQRRMVLQELNQTLMPAERTAGVTYDDDPRSLARLATRAEMRQPGTLERTWSSMPAIPGVGLGGMGMGSYMMSNFMGTFAGVMLGSVVANAFLGDAGYDQGYADGLSGGDAQGSESGDVGDAGSDAGGVGDSGGDFGGFGDFGGGDFGGDF